VTSGHLGYEKHDLAGQQGSGNSRNGTTPKTVLTGVGAVDLVLRMDCPGSIGRLGLEPAQ
jgi:putative transposase